MSELYIANHHNPYENIALEYELFHRYNSNQGIIFFLWVNDPCIVMGRNQNYYEEVNAPLARHHGVHITRRLSGGGAVYHDHGNLNFTFIYSETIDFNPSEAIRDALEFSGIQSVRNERNDILIDGRKFSGQSQLIEDGKVLFHGTLLIDVDLEFMNEVLTPSKLKLDSHQIASVRSRVINLGEKFPVTVASLTDSLAKYFCESYAARRKKCDYTNLEILEKLRSSEWIYRENANFDVAQDFKTSIGNVGARFSVKDGRIISTKIYSDAYLITDFHLLAEQLNHQLYDEDRIKQQILEFIQINLKNKK